MAAYDPNWLMKERSKQWARQESTLSHIAKSDDRNTMLCGRGWGAKGHPSIHTVSFPSPTNLPGCRTCREAYLTSIGVPFDDVGYPIKYEVAVNDRKPYPFFSVVEAIRFSDYWNAVPLFSFKHP